MIDPLKILPDRVRTPLLELEFRRRGPWVSRFQIDGHEYGGDHTFADDRRLAQFAEAFPDAERILELGSLEGGHTFELAGRPGASVVAIEGRTENIRRARLVQDLLRANNAVFFHADLEESPPASFGLFDVVFCVGLLYHLPRPWYLVDRLRDAAPGVFLWTHYAPDESDDILDGSPGRWYDEHGLADPLSGLSARSFWPTLGSLIDRFRAAGFPEVELIEDEPDHPHGPAITLAARA